MLVRPAIASMTIYLEIWQFRYLNVVAQHQPHSRESFASLFPISDFEHTQPHYSIHKSTENYFGWGFFSDLENIFIFLKDFLGA